MEASASVDVRGHGVFLADSSYKNDHPIRFHLSVLDLQLSANRATRISDDEPYTADFLSFFDFNSPRYEFTAALHTNQLKLRRRFSNAGHDRKPHNSAA